MKHSFSPSFADPLACRVCKYDKLSHTKEAECEVCGEHGECDVLYGNILMCQSCQAKEQAAQAVNNTPEAIETRVANVKSDTLIGLIDKNKEIESSIHVDTDIHNAKMIAIVDLKKSIDEDSTILPEQKLFTLAKTIDDRYEVLKTALGNLKQEITENENEQRAIQTYYNELAKKLKEDERAQLKLKDVNYKPIEGKPKKSTAPKTKQLDKIQLSKFAGDIEKEFPALKGLALTTLQTVMVSTRAQSVEAAYNILKGMLTESTTKA